MAHSIHYGFRLLNYLIGSTLLSLVAACSYLSPYVLPKSVHYCDNPAPDPNNACIALRQTTAAVTNTISRADAIKGKVTDTLGTTNVNRALGIATFGLASAVAVRTAGEAPQAATRNLALGAGATYAATNLFAQPSTEALYLAGFTSMVCIASKGNEVLANYDAAQYAMKIADNDPSVSNFLKTCENDNNLPEDVKNALGDYHSSKNTASEAMARVRSMDPSIANTVNNASTSLLLEINKQLLSQSPSIDAILQAGKSSAAMASALMQKGAAGAANGQKEKSVCKPEDLVEPHVLQSVANQYKSVTSILTQTLNQIGDLRSGCAMAPAVVSQPLSVNQTEVVLDPGTTSTLVIAGGRAPYHAEWLAPGPDETKQLKKGDFDQLGHLALTAISTDKDNVFTLQITDSGVVPSVVKIAVRLHSVPTKPASQTTLSQL